jgi:hypothetical protein
MYMAAGVKSIFFYLKTIYIFFAFAMLLMHGATILYYSTLLLHVVWCHVYCRFEFFPS